MLGKTKHLSTKRNLIIILVVVIIGCFGFYYFDKVKPYNDLLTSANKAITTEDYDNAIKFYTEAETYKKTSDIDKKIQFTGILKKSKENYDSAMQKMKGKDYLSAIDNFKKVDKQDNKRYSDTQNKINECKKLKGEIDADQKQNSQAKTAETSSGAPAANGPVTFDQALQIVINSNDFKEVIKGATKVSNTLYQYPHNGPLRYPDQNTIALLTDDKNPKIDNSYGWNVVNGKNVYSIDTCYINSFGAPFWKFGYLVEASTGKLYRWDSGHAKQIN